MVHKQLEGGLLENIAFQFAIYFLEATVATLNFMQKHIYSPNVMVISDESNRTAMNRNWSNQKANPALKTKAGNK